MKTNSNSNKQFLNNAEMKCIVGGINENQQKQCDDGASVRCNQDTPDTIPVANCKRSTVESVCGGNVSNAVCIC